MPLERRHELGNPGHRPLPPVPSAGQGLTAATTVPRVPRRLNTDGRRAWRSIWSGAKSWLSPELDPIAVESLAYDYQRLCDLRDKISSGDIPQWTSNEAGRLFAHPAIAQVASLEARVMAWSAQLGLSPSDRARLGLSQVRVRDADDEVSERSKAREIEREVQRRLYLISMEHQAE